MMRWSAAILICAAVLAVSPALAQQPDVGKSRWALKVGLATSPDQVVGGVNFLETEIANNVYLEPNAELGIGDSSVIVSATAPFHYRFTVDAKVKPYVGGGVTLGVAWVDKNNNNETDFEIALRGTGGIFWQLDGGRVMFAELNLIFGDLHDFQAMVGWRF